LKKLEASLSKKSLKSTTQADRRSFFSFLSGSSPTQCARASPYLLPSIILLHSLRSHKEQTHAQPRKELSRFENIIITPRGEKQKENPPLQELNEKKKTRKYENFN
jgi:hypothetical protein